MSYSSQALNTAFQVFVKFYGCRHFATVDIKRHFITNYVLLRETTWQNQIYIIFNV